MNWLIHNINHFTVPLGILLGICGAILGYSRQRSSKRGIPNPLDTASVRGFMIVLIIVCAILLGIAIAHNSGA